MASPSRIEFGGALCNVASRGAGTKVVVRRQAAECRLSLESNGRKPAPAIGIFFWKARDSDYGRNYVSGSFWATTSSSRRCRSRLWWERYPQYSAGAPPIVGAIFFFADIAVCYDQRNSVIMAARASGAYNHPKIAAHYRCSSVHYRPYCASAHATMRELTPRLWKKSSTEAHPSPVLG